MKRASRVIVISLALGLANILLAGLQYFIFNTHLSLLHRVLLFAGLVFLTFFILPFLNARYKQAQRLYSEREVPEGFAKYFEEFSHIVNNAYYSSDYNAKRHMRKRALAYIPTYNSAKCNIFKFLIYALTSIAIISYLFPQYLFYVLILASITFCLKFYMRKQQVNLFIANVPEDKVAEYYRNILFDTECMHDIKIYGYEEQIAQKSITAFREGLNKRYQLRHINAIAYPLIKGFLVLSLGLIIYQIATHATMNLGGFIATVTTVYGLLSQLDPFTDALFQFEQARSILKISSLENLDEARYSETGQQLDTIKEIRLENVSFSYEPGKPILKNINFTWNTDQGVSIIGANGSGKTTLLKLIMGLNRPSSGAIYVNGQALEELNAESYFARLGICLQDFVIFEDSLSHNIYFSKKPNGHQHNSADLEPMAWSDPLMQELLSFAQSLPSALNTPLGQHVFPDGIELSKGQEQRVALCRALAKDSSLFLLDEPTASLDPHMEHDFFQMYKSLAAKKSSLLVTHRIGFAGLSDRIIVMKNGEIIEDGRHEELISAKGTYYEMYMAQAQMYQ